MTVTNRTNSFKEYVLKFFLSQTRSTGKSIAERERQRVEELSYQQEAERQERVAQEIKQVLDNAGIRSGKFLEIGGRLNPMEQFFPQFECVNLDLEHTDENVIIGDITHCPEIANDTFDVIISFDVFEHINRPWKAAEEIIRILKPGGLTYHSTLWSWRYHPCPIDYWRFSPDALEFLFDGLETVVKEFDTVERRRNILGQGRYKLKSDAFGGWRENWRVHYAGRKN